MPPLDWTSEKEGPLAYWTYVTSALAVLALARTIVPQEWLDRAQEWFSGLLASLDPFCFFTFPEYSGASPDQHYELVKLYLGSKDIFGAKRVLVNLPRNAKQPLFSLADGESFRDEFKGFDFEWVHRVKERTGNLVATDGEVQQEVRSFRLRVHRKAVPTVVQYVEHIASAARKLEQLDKELLIHSNIDTYWDEQPFSHPSTFETLALDPDLKRLVKDRLTEFKADREYFARTGRAQKVGFLLHGPPGTGKSSFIAAVANFMHYDVYDLNLSAVNNDHTLRSLLACLSNNCCVVVEDIDTAGLPDRRGTGNHAGKGTKGKKDEGPTLGGMLNFTDGLLSSSGSERIFIFTTNHPEHLDAALTRPGRCDLHIPLSFCNARVFKHLCSTYLGLQDDKLMLPVCALLEYQKAQITPAQVAGLFDAHKGDPAGALKAVHGQLESGELKFKADIKK
ncbi:hypothetical protein WJX74_002203 [Apatococcus lobatus]|uniref:AAA+ ATPase domain-containing protein n=1 Tax=Apatococcus lobatus TaxID=904363 RepID=A0AAW1QKW0_9CHLO